jgi:hypothetical protein
MCLVLQNIKVSPETKLQHWLVHVYANTHILTAPGGYKISGCQVRLSDTQCKDTYVMYD